MADDKDFGLLKRLAKPLRLKVRLDECNDPIVQGKLGQFYEWDSEHLGALFMPPRPMKGWKNRREALESLGWIVVQSGDFEGAAILEIPTKLDPDTTKAIKVAAKLLGIRLRRELAEAERKRALMSLERANLARTVNDGSENPRGPFRAASKRL